MLHASHPQKQINIVFVLNISQNKVFLFISVPISIYSILTYPNTQYTNEKTNFNLLLHFLHNSTPTQGHHCGTVGIALHTHIFCQFNLERCRFQTLILNAVRVILSYIEQNYQKININLNKNWMWKVIWEAFRNEHKKGENSLLLLNI